jgi:hypothetical protein
MRRYADAPLMSGGTRYGSSETVYNIRNAISSGALRCREQVMTETQRLDVLAGIEYGDSSLWWIIAAASNIGWGMQIPPGNLIRIPRLEDVGKFI